MLPYPFNANAAISMSVTFELVRNEIIKRAEPSEELYVLTEPENGRYFGAQLFGFVFKGNFWNAVLAMDEFLKKNTKYEYASCGHVEFLKREYKLALERFLYYSDDSDQNPSADDLLKLIRKNLTECNYLFISELKI